MERQEESSARRLIWPHSQENHQGGAEKSRPVPPAENGEGQPFDPIRREQGLVQWEASCMKNVAALLDDMESARTQWEALAKRLAEAEARLHEETARRAEASTGREEERTLRASAEEALAAARREIEALRSDSHGGKEAAQREISELREKLDALRAEVATTHARLEMVEGQRDRAELARLELEGKLGQIDDLREELEEERRLREGLAQASLEWQATQEALGRAHAKIEALQKEADESMMLVCDLRFKLNKAEEARHEASSQGKQKLRKILAKIHADLDAAGAPQGEELSFGERIRLLRKSLDSQPGTGPVA